MSECRHYEFHAVEQLLTEREMAELRSYSTHAGITPTSFVDEYS